MHPRAPIVTIALLGVVSVSHDLHPLMLCACEWEH
jgi:hypothetical protein